MAEVLEVTFSDFQAKKNNTLHHTDDISVRRLIVRRGQYFIITLHFKTRGFQQGEDNIIFITETGPWPDEASGTKAIFSLSKALNKQMWTTTMQSNGPNAMVVAVFSPANAIIGQYTLKIQVTRKSKSATYELGKFVLLFNPWCADDDVYMENDSQRQEYVMNDYGFVYQGNHNWISPCPWNFGQFEDDILDISLKMLDKNLNFLQDAFKDLSRRNSPIYISRVVCAMINSNDDNGVLQGNWGDDFNSGVSPSTWNGSVAILRQWYKSDCHPVKYGQCWVFAAVMCTVMRSLGIPTRVITNFDSAHDTNQNLLIDQYYDSTGKKIPNKSSDSIWNFHVWCESWMARRDLPPGYGGWQVLDPTPQETSNGIYCCGPASVKAIQEGDVHLSYDCPFVFAMVNADCVSWTLYGSRKEKHYCDPHLIGNRISTKSVGSDEREDVTQHYKFEEGTNEERKTFQKAINRLQNKRALLSFNESEHSNGTSRMSANGYPPVFGRASEDETYDKELRHNRPLSDAKLLLKFKLTESPQLGQTISLALLASNMVLIAKTLKLYLSAQSMKHNGEAGQQFWKDSIYIELGPREEKLILLNIPYAKYGPFLGDNNLIRFVAVGEQNVTWEKLLVEKDVTLALPDVIINFRSPVVVNRPCKVQMTFCNPLNEEVHNCLLEIEGSGLLKTQLRLNVGTMQAREKSILEFEVVPCKPGIKQLQVNISSNKFKVLKGFKSVVVKP
ncbi:protein-glutamine gamma-glutamyltransferase 5-like [Rhinophrynus dorsalis]